MQKVIDTAYLDWSRTSKPVVRARGTASIILPQLKQTAAAAKEQARFIWPSGFDNVNPRYLSRRVWSR